VFRSIETRNHMLDISKSSPSYTENRPLLNATSAFEMRCA